MYCYLPPYIDIVNMSPWCRICQSSGSDIGFVIDDSDAGGGYGYGEGEGGADLSL